MTAKVSELLRLDGRVAIVTGGYAWLGNDMARALAEYGAVSRQTAEQMARGIAAFCGAQIGVGVTGIAGPGSDGTDKPVGLIYIGIWTADGFERVVGLRNVFTDDVRARNRAAAVDAAFALIGEYLDYRESNHGE